MSAYPERSSSRDRNKDPRDRERDRERRERQLKHGSIIMKTNNRSNTPPVSASSSNGSYRHTSRNVSSHPRSRSHPHSSSSSSSPSSSHKEMNNIESSVTRLLIATKQLIETLTEWSFRRATEIDVSDVYVSLGNEFNVARTCFERVGIDMTYTHPCSKTNVSDLADIPTQLREVLETCLARDASQETLNKYLPDVRRIIINLLQGLKRKQSTYRTRPTEQEDEQSTRQRQQSMTPDRSSMDKEVKDRRTSPARRPVGSRSKSKDDTMIQEQQMMQGQPTITTQPASPVTLSQSPLPTTPPQQSIIIPASPTNDALTKLQTSDALQRRASKRYSAYNFAKLDGIPQETKSSTAPPPIPSRRNTPYSQEQPHQPRQQSPEQTTPAPASIPEDREKAASPGTRIAVFLQLGTGVRKTVVTLSEFTMQSLRLLFVEKFQYNPGEETFPDILITDRDTGVRYILESMADITEGSTLTLDVEGLHT